MKRVLFPFAAVVGQQDIKNAIIWNIVNPKIGGLLISGEKGTAKSTVVRAAAELTDNLKIIEIPIGITEDRLVGSVDFSSSVKDGKTRIEKGLLAEADKNIVYIDEVNLLGDHIMNAILQVAGNGENIVEREGISDRQSSEFVLIGSMNPEEGKLKGQFLDRFGLYISAEGERNIPTRIEILEHALEFEKDPVAYREKFREETEALKEKIALARKNLVEVEITEAAMMLASELSMQAHTEGHRAEKVIIEAARAIAALEGRTTVNVSDIKEASQFALPHRLRNVENEQQRPEPQEQEENSPENEEPQENEPEENEAPGEQEEPENRDPEEKGEGEEAPQQNTSPSDEGGDYNPEDNQPEEKPDEVQDDVEEAGEPFVIKSWKSQDINKKVNIGTGKRDLVISKTKQGRYVRYKFPKESKITDIAFDATLRAAAPFQKNRDRSKTFIAIKRSDIRTKIREKRTGGCILFVVDASASMGANRRMKEVKAAILSLLNVSYQKRDKVGLIAFRKDEASLLLNITNSVELAQKQLAELPTGGKTPLAKGLALAYEVMTGLRIKDPDIKPTMVLVSDGRASGNRKKGGPSPFDEALVYAEKIGNSKINTIILDTENDFIKFHLCDKLNEKLHGTLLSIEELRAEGIVETVNAFASR